MHRVGASGKHIFGMGQLQIPVACYRKGGCTPEGIPVNPAPEWWGVGPNNPPNINERIERNSKVIWDTLSKFPYPAPFLPGESVSFFLSKLKPELQEIAASVEEINPDGLRIWITLQVLTHYDEWTQMIQQAQDRLAKRRKKIALTRTIAITVASIVVGIAAPMAIMALISAVKTATEYYINAKNAKEAAKSLAEAEKAFAESDPEFAKEVDKAQKAMEDYAAKIEASTAPQGKVPPTGVAPPPAPAAQGGPSLATSLAVGGGIAAVGVVVLSLLKP